MQKLRVGGRLNFHIRDLLRCGLRYKSSSLTELDQWLQPRGQFSGIEIYNCAARRKVPLVLSNDTYAKWYTCGPTVYDSTHLGHASCYVKLDIIQRILREHFNYNLVTAMNITDIDDKIIRKSQESGRNWRELARGYEAEFWSDLRKLNVQMPNMTLRVTDHVPKIVEFIGNLVKKDQAYVGPDKSVYFNVKNFKRYGKLQNISKSSEQVAPNAEIKSANEDFALWKAQKTPNEPSWPSPWGAGRPGWHIECSTLATMLFGGSVDFHAGGLDLRFPHHENEEAQSCAFHNSDQWVNYWIHTGQLNVKGDTEKMSKSLRNTISVSEMLDNFSADDFRMACLLSNYRNSMSYGEEVMENARQILYKFKSFNVDCNAYLTGKKLPNQIDVSAIQAQLSFSTEQVDACLRNDFDTARAIAVIMDQMSSISRCINTPNELPADAALQTASCLDGVAAVYNFVLRSMRCFGLTTLDGGMPLVEEASQAIDLNGLLEDILVSRKIIRERAVAAKNNDLFQICDELRNCLRQHGIEIRDHGQGSSWSYVASNRK